jgi:hypothetical protein
MIAMSAQMRLLASGGSSVGAGLIAFIVVVALCVASYFLFRSMNRHLRKVPPSFEPASTEKEETK